jgi:hypothetical protein
MQYFQIALLLGANPATVEDDLKVLCAQKNSKIVVA